MHLMADDSNKEVISCLGLIIAVVILYFLGSAIISWISSNIFMLGMWTLGILIAFLIVWGIYRLHKMIHESNVEKKSFDNEFGNLFKIENQISAMDKTVAGHKEHAVIYDKYI